MNIPEEFEYTLDKPQLNSRAKILEAAQKLFIKYGYSSVSLRNIAKEAGISHAGVLRNFNNKDAILTTIIKNLDKAMYQYIDLNERSRSIIRLAKRNATIPGYVEIFTSIAGQATSPTHPTHKFMTDRYKNLKSLMSDWYHSDIVAVSRIAIWDGIQLSSLMFDEIDVPTELDRYLKLKDKNIFSPNTHEFSISNKQQKLNKNLYNARGTIVRESILKAATTTFTKLGYFEASMSKIANEAKISKSVLYHYFKNKKDLLLNVIAEHESLTTAIANANIKHNPDFSKNLKSFITKWITQNKDSIALLVSLKAEASSPHHPVHEIFKTNYQQEFQQLANYFTTFLKANNDSLKLKANTLAIFLQALCEGMQIQWLYDAKHTEIPEILVDFFTILSLSDHQK
ncbi:MAG: TetR/AcrR family transcriptional regulator [Micrococcaceae bacterium]